MDVLAGGGREYDNHVVFKAISDDMTSRMVAGRRKKGRGRQSCDRRGA